MIQFSLISCTFSAGEWSLKKYYIACTGPRRTCECVPTGGDFCFRGSRFLKEYFDLFRIRAT